MPGARVPLDDPAFLYGDGVFETIRIHGGAPFRLDAHLGRLERGLKTVRLRTPARLRDVRGAMRSLVAACRMDAGLVRVTVGAPLEGRDGTVAITARELPSPPPEVALHVVEAVRRTPGPLSACKTTSRVVERIALREAHAHGAYDGVLLNDEGRVIETSARNLFLVLEGRLVTPPPSEGALAGITRAAVLEAAKDFRIEASEAPVPLDAIARADEMFLTGSGVGILGVSRCGERAFPRAPGPVTERLASAYRRLLDVESRW